MWIRPSTPPRSTNAPKSVTLPDDAFADLSLRKFCEGFLTMLFLLALQNPPPTDDQIVRLLIELRHLGDHLLADEDGDVAIEIKIDLAGGHEGANAFDLQLKAALVHAGDHAFDDCAKAQIVPRNIGREHAFAVDQQDAFGFVVAIDGEIEFVADLDFGELRERRHGLRLTADIDEDVVRADGDDLAALDAAGFRGAGARS